MPIIGMLRIKNEARWIERVLRSIFPICTSVHVFDDHSTDGTPEICESLGATVYRSLFAGLDERRDKNFLLRKIYQSDSEIQYYGRGREDSPYWALCIDGDEELETAGRDVILQAIANPQAMAYSLRIKYLWNSDSMVRVDGVYRTFARPSLFRLINASFEFQATPWGRQVEGNKGNLHCSSIPQEMIHGYLPCEAALLHYGYIDAALRRRKFDWYNTVDANNPIEDFYRHCIQGDEGGPQADEYLLHAGPLQLEPLAALQ